MEKPPDIPSIELLERISKNTRAIRVPKISHDYFKDLLPQEISQINFFNWLFLELHYNENFRYAMIEIYEERIKKAKDIQNNRMEES